MLWLLLVFGAAGAVAFGYRQRSKRRAEAEILPMRPAPKTRSPFPRK